MTLLLRALLLATPLALAACSGTTEDPAAITADEDRQLNDAADMLDANSVSLNALDEDTQ